MSGHMSDSVTVTVTDVGVCGSYAGRWIGWTAIRIVLRAGTHGGRYLLGGRRADYAAARGVLSVCRGGAARRWPSGRSK